MVTCSKRNEEIIASGRSTGYGKDQNDNILCFSCIETIEKEEIANTELGGKHLFYFTEEKTGETTFKELVSNWPGNIKYQVYYSREGHHNFGLKMISVWFRDHVNNHWYGRIINPDFNQAFYAKRIKN
jgi:hypothetical protein